MKKRPKVLIIFMSIFLLYFGYTMVTQQIKLLELSKEKKAYEEQIEKRKMEIDSLKKQLEEVQSPSYIEKIAREKLKMVRPDEIIFILEDNINNK